MQARFKGEPGGDAVCVAFGTEFPAGDWVDFDHPKLAGNPMFETRETPKPAAQAASPAASRAARKPE